MANVQEPPTSIGKRPAGQFLKLREAAIKISATTRFLQRRIACGEIQVLNPSRRMVRISRAELSRWIQRYTHGGHLNPAKAAIPETEGREVTG
jgi:hypothetical protein